MAGSAIDHGFSGNLLGKAEDPTYAGVLSFMRRRYTKNLDGADFVIWGIPFDSAVTNRPGARFGPQAIRAASAIFDNDPQYPFARDLFSQTAVVDFGDCLFDAGRPWEFVEQARMQAKSIIEQSCYLLSMGGDHFVTWPLLLAHSEMHGPLSLIQFDAHQDTWDDDNERIDHGSFVARAVNAGVIDPDSSIQIGIRTHAPQDFGIEIIYGDEVDEMNSDELVQAISARVKNKPCYLTFDIDCLDPAFAPGTGTPVAGGPSSAKMLSVLRKLGRLDIRGCDVVEVSPAYDHAQITAIAGATVMMYLLGTQIEKRLG